MTFMLYFLIGFIVPFCILLRVLYPKFQHFFANPQAYPVMVESYTQEEHCKGFSFETPWPCDVIRFV